MNDSTIDSPQHAGPDCESADLSDLQWTAFLYVAGELSGDEAAAFEMLLANDVRACEAVARAVQCGQAVRRGFEQVAVEPAAAGVFTRSNLRRIVSVAVSAAVVAVAATGLFFLSPHENRSSMLAERQQQAGEAGALDADSLDSATAELVVEAWVNAHARLEPMLDAAIPEAAGEIPDVPDWMLAAVMTEDAEPEVGRP